MERPIGVKLISFFYIFGAVVLLLTSIFYNHEQNVIGIAKRFGVPNAPERILRIILALLTFVMVYGYANLKKWGYWSMIAYSILFGLLSMTLMTTQNIQPFLGNMIWSLIILIYSICIKAAFFKSKEV
ncbi:hypothetical protein ACQKM9_04605 [Viridibacillus sp. NPDC093762]|uniref:hypothetical protein n=1 Tax=Viridibacillus sp. NPDC093762 TaxID=3390720 RepID=UPI003CFC1C26